MDRQKQLLNDINNVIGAYDLMLIECSGKCNPEAYKEDIASIGRSFMLLTGNKEALIKEVNSRIEDYSSESNKKWRYIDKMLSYLAFVQDIIRSV